MSFLVSYIALWCFAVVLALMAVGLLREVTLLRRSLAQGGLDTAMRLPLGGRTPKFSAIDGRTGVEMQSEIITNRTSVILFVSPSCSVCHRVVHGLSSGSVAGGSFRLFILCKGTSEECRGFIETIDPGIPLLLDPRARIAELYGISRYPVAVVVDRGRVRRYGYPTGAQDLGPLVENAVLEVDPSSVSHPAPG